MDFGIFLMREIVNFSAINLAIIALVLDDDEEISVNKTYIGLHGMDIPKRYSKIEYAKVFLLSFLISSPILRQMLFLK